MCTMPLFRSVIRPALLASSSRTRSYRKVDHSIQASWHIPGVPLWPASINSPPEWWCGHSCSSVSSHAQEWLATNTNSIASAVAPPCWVKPRTRQYLPGSQRCRIVKAEHSPTGSTARELVRLPSATSSAAPSTPCWTGIRDRWPMCLAASTRGWTRQLISLLRLATSRT